MRKHSFGILLLQLIYNFMPLALDFLQFFPVTVTELAKCLHNAVLLIITEFT